MTVHPTHPAEHSYNPDPGTEYPFSVSDIARAAVGYLGSREWLAESGSWGVTGYISHTTVPTRYTVAVDNEGDLYVHADPEGREYLEGASAADGLPRLALIVTNTIRRMHGDSLSGRTRRTAPAAPGAPALPAIHLPEGLDLAGLTIYSIRIVGLAHSRGLRPAWGESRGHVRSLQLNAQSADGAFGSIQIGKTSGRVLRAEITPAHSRQALVAKGAMSVRALLKSLPDALTDRP